jgi:PTH1 family peptidyl-tRNA hydrolase
LSARLRQAFARQGEVTGHLGSPFMARLMPLIGARLTDATAVGARCLAWEGDVSAAAQSVPLRLAGALHGLVLDGIDAPLAAAYPPNQVSDDALWQAVETALTTHETRIMDWLDRAPQTNEVRRATAILTGIWWALERVEPRTVCLSELGASAGLNLSMDRFALSRGRGLHVAPQSAVRLAPEWTGPSPTPAGFSVTDRAGVDIAPLDPTSPADRLRLLAYLWPDQPERLARTRAAIDLADTRVDADDAAPWLARRLATPYDGLHVVYSTIAAQYFPPATLASISDTLTQAGQRATADAPLLHLAMEADDDTPGAGLTATLWAGGAAVQRQLARVDFHGAWVVWRDEAFASPRFPLPQG